MPAHTANTNLASAAASSGHEPTGPGPILPELLAPAGDWECARAAVENGADAIYFGLERFNARMRARNFTTADLPALMAFLHQRGVRGYVTFNTLVFEDELQDAERTLREIIAAGVDAAIVQDVGLCRLIRDLSPDFPIHASTQMTITSAAGVRFARQLGCDLVVLARECSLKETDAIRRQLQTGSPPGSDALPLEIFVHGALCVAYSGQCLTSEALGGRSANRGECAQACRMPYEMVVDGRPHPLGDRRYLLSPQDLAGLEVLPQAIAAGIASLKIEGRLKSPEYVANITRVYRKALDDLASRADLPDRVDPNPYRYDLEMAFSRGLHTGWLGGVNNQQLVHARFGKKRGVFLGRVTRLEGQRVFLKLEAPLKPGDGVVFDAGRPDQPEEGGRVYSVDPVPTRGGRDQEFVLGFGRGEIDYGRLQPGDRLWKTSDPELDRRLRQTFAGDQPRFQRPLQMIVTGAEGQPLCLVAEDESGRRVEVQSRLPLSRAEKRPLSEPFLREQLGRLGGTAYRLGSLLNRLEPGLIIPVSELNRLRRDMVAQLDEARARPLRWTLRDPSSPTSPPLTAKTPSTEPELIVLVRSQAQLEALLPEPPPTLYCEFENPKHYRESVRLLQSARCGHRRPEVFVAPPRIFKTGEDWILKLVRSSEPDGVLVRNYDHLEQFKDLRRVGDFSLNVANHLTAADFMERHGLERLTASYDLNITQLEALLRGAPPAWFEVTLHQHMPMFHMEHCVFCAFLSSGTDYTNCGRPCDQHRVELKDRVGALHPLKADAGCRNTLFNARPQTGAEYARRLLDLGVRRFRLEFLNETGPEVVATVAKYQELLAGRLSGSDLWRSLHLHHQLGVTRGPLEHA